MGPPQYQWLNWRFFACETDPYEYLFLTLLVLQYWVLVRVLYNGILEYRVVLHYESNTG